MYDDAELKAAADTLRHVTDEVRGAIVERDDAIRVIRAQLTEIEQKMARRGGFTGLPGLRSLGETFVQSESFKSLAGSNNQRGEARIALGPTELKTILSASGTWGATASPSNSLVPADRERAIVQLPHRPLVVRDLLGAAETSSNAVEYGVQTGFTNNAAVVAENTTKPTSDMTFDLRTAAVRTIAHKTKASRQILDDAPALRGLIDSEMRYGLEYAEEAELLYGDGTGQHLNGIVTQATAYSAPFAVTGETPIDRLSLALLQSELALLPASGIVLHPTDLRKILMVKDSMGRYIAADPLGQSTLTMLWGVPVASSLAVTAGTFVVGAFKTAATLYDRMAVEVLISTEDEDNFSRNMVTVRCEERVALAVRRPTAFITGTLP